MDVQKRAMETNMKYMIHSMKPTLVTFIPLIIVFGWMSAHLAYNPIIPGQEFNSTALFNQGVTGNAILIIPEQLTMLSNDTQKIEDGKAQWTLKGPNGEYLLEYKIGNETQTREILIDEQNYIDPTKKN